MKVQKSYPKEFRDSAVQLVMNSDKSALKVAEELGVNPKTIYNWIREYKKLNNINGDYRNNSGISKKSVTKEALEEENRRLRAENRELKQERDILKKATAYFAKATM